MNKGKFLDNFNNKEGYLQFGTHVFSIELRNKYPFLTNIQIANIINNQNKILNNS